MQGFYCVDITDSAGDTAYSPASSLTINQPQPLPFQGGSSGGSGFNGYFYSPNYKRTAPILAQPSINQTCSSLVNTTVSSFQTIVFNGTSYDLLTKYLSPGSGTFILNGTTVSLSEGGKQYLGAPNNSDYFTLFNTYELMPQNYTAAVQVADVGLCRNLLTPRLQARPTVPFVPVQFQLNINGYVINATSSVPNDTVSIYFNGVQMASGNGTAVYNATWVPAGRYLVEAKDLDSGSFVNKTMVKPYFNPQLSFTGSCKSSQSTYSSCTTTAQVTSYNQSLIGSLFVNGRFVGSTGNTINYTPPHAGIYNITFKTAGSELYSPYSISYQYSDDPFGAYAVPAIVVGLSMCSLILVSRKVSISTDI